MYNVFQPEKALSINELKDAFYSPKTNKSPGYDDISSIIKRCFGIWIDLFITSIIFIYNRVFFRRKWKLLGSLQYVKEVKYLIYETIVRFLFSVAFRKFSKKNMYNRLYKHLYNNNILYKKQFGFQENHSTDHEVI